MDEFYTFEGKSTYKKLNNEISDDGTELEYIMNSNRFLLKKSDHLL